MGQVTVNEAIALLSSDKLKERTEGLESMKRPLELLISLSNHTRFEAHSPAEQAESEAVRQPCLFFSSMQLN